MKNARAATDNAGGRLGCGAAWQTEDHVRLARVQGRGLPKLGESGFREWEGLPADRPGTSKGQPGLVPGPTPHPTRGQRPPAEPAVGGPFQPLCRLLNEGGGRPLSSSVIWECPASPRAGWLKPQTLPVPVLGAGVRDPVSQGWSPRGLPPGHADGRPLPVSPHSCPSVRVCVLVSSHKDPSRAGSGPTPVLRPACPEPRPPGVVLAEGGPGAPDLLGHTWKPPSALAPALLLCYVSFHNPTVGASSARGTCLGFQGDLGLEAWLRSPP